MDTKRAAEARVVRAAMRFCRTGWFADYSIEDHRKSICSLKNACAALERARKAVKP